MHPVALAVKAEFDRVEQALIEQVATGRVNDWPSYQKAVGRIQEVREGRARAVESIAQALGAEDE